MREHPVDRLLVGGDERPAGARFDREVAKRDAAFDRKLSDRFALVLDDASERAARGNLAKNVEREVLCRRAVRELAADRDFHRGGEAVDERLGRENVFDFGRADAETQSAQGAVGGRVAVAADHDHARTHEASFGHDDVLEPLIGVVRAEEGLDAEAAAVGFERFGLLERRRVVDAAGTFVARGNDVAHDAEVRVGREDGKAPGGDARKGLGRRVFVREVRVAVKKDGVRVDRLHGVCVDDLSIERSGLGHEEVSCRGRRAAGGGRGCQGKSVVPKPKAGKSGVLTTSVRKTQRWDAQGDASQASKRNAIASRKARSCAEGFFAAK